MNPLTPTMETAGTLVTMVMRCTAGEDQGKGFQEGEHSNHMIIGQFIYNLLRLLRCSNYFLANFFMFSLEVKTLIQFTDPSNSMFLYCDLVC